LLYDIQDVVGKTKAIARTIKLLSSNTCDEKHTAISFLLELSKSQLLLECIGSMAGSILILTTMKINSPDDPIASEKAGAVLMLWRRWEVWSGETNTTPGFDRRG
jgi:hypothetical protein